MRRHTTNYAAQLGAARRRSNEYKEFRALARARAGRVARPQRAGETLCAGLHPKLHNLTPCGVMEQSVQPSPARRAGGVVSTNIP